MLRSFEGHWNVIVSLLVRGAVLTLMLARKLQVSSFCKRLSCGSPLWLGMMRFSDLESLYPDSLNIYQRHIHDAKFYNVLRRDSRLESRKLRVTSVLYLLDKYQDLGPETRAELTQSLLKNDFQRAQQILPTTEDTKRSKGVLNWAVDFLIRPSGGAGSLKGEMKILSSSISDSQFLCDMKNVENQDLRPMIQELEDSAHTQLASLIDTTVKLMTHAVSAMQQDYCRRSIQHEIESEERTLLSSALMEFIQQINTQSARKRDS
jgi:hypothetical protein